MGGKAFAAGHVGLLTPRMPPHIYSKVMCHCCDILRQYFKHVATPIEAPQKIDYGDVDFLVAQPYSPEISKNQGMTRTTAEILAKAFEAERFISVSGNPTMSFAVRWPVSDSAADLNQVVPGAVGANIEHANIFTQVDVHICESEQNFKWELFHTAHADLWNILGSTIRSCGLTVNGQGLYLRIKDIEAFDRRRSLILLTSDPDVVLQFLHLDAERYWKPFQTIYEMFEYAAHCRFFYVKDAEKAEDIRTLKSNDRKRMRHRPIFRMWIEDFMPACREKGLYARRSMSPEDVRDDAFTTFGVREEYEQRRLSFLLEKDREGVGKWIKATVPSEGVETSVRSAAIRGMKAIVEGGGYEGLYTEQPVNFLDEKGFFVEKSVIDFVLRHWSEVGKATLEREHVRAGERMQKKALERAQKDAVEEANVIVDAIVH